MAQSRRGAKAQRDLRNIMQYGSGEDLGQLRVSLKQWQTFHAVVSCGSFSNAAELLHVTQPAISHTIARLEEELGIALLKQDGRKAEITETGRELLMQARPLLREAFQLEMFAKNLRHGREPEIRLAISSDFSMHLLVRTLRTFSARWQTVKVHLVQVMVSEIEMILRQRVADVAINTSVPSGFHAHPFLETEYVPVANPKHLLCALGRELIEQDLESQIEVVIRSSETGFQSSQPGDKPNGNRRWVVGSFDAAKTVVMEGMGYGWLPKTRIQHLLDVGSLKILPLQHASSRRIKFFLIDGRSPVSSVWVARFADAFNSCAEESVKLREDGA